MFVHLPSNTVTILQLLAATSCRLIYRINTAHLSTTHTHGTVATGSDKHLSDKIRTLYLGTTFL